MIRLVRSRSFVVVAALALGVGACSGESDTGEPDDEPTCSEVPAGSLCVQGLATSAGGDMLVVGDKLRILVRPDGCFSSSCTVVETATCSVSGGGSEFTASSDFCLTDDSVGKACTDDCGGGGFATCESDASLTAGTKTVTLGTLSVTFMVPGLLDSATSCASRQ